jgi:hypothetical protein
VLRRANEDTTAIGIARKAAHEQAHHVADAGWPNGNTPRRRYYTLDLFKRACDGERTPDLELIAESISSIEPGGGHMLDMVRALLNRAADDGPADDTQGGPQT